MDTSLLEALRADPGLQRTAAEALRSDGDRAPLTLRKAGVEPGLAAAALTLADLREHAKTKLGERAEKLYFTRAGLEQATRWVVAERRATRFARSAGEVTDLCCGMGTDALAFAEAGLKVEAVDINEETAAYARANAEAAGLAVEVKSAMPCPCRWGNRCSRIRPAESGGTRNFNPAEYSPPLDHLLKHMGSARYAAVKLGPGISHEWLPEGAEAEWVSVDRDVVEACLWLGEAAEVSEGRACARRGYGSS